MTRDEILAEVVSTMAETFELDPADIKLESKLFDDLDLDSIDAIDMAVKMQEMTGQRLDEDSLRGLRTVGDVVDLIAELSAAKQS